MIISKVKYFFLAILFFNSFGTVKAQGGFCPSNLDFELGNFSGWVCRAGSALSFPLPVTGPIPGRHTIIDAATAGIDPFGFFPEICPNGSGFSVKLGNQINGTQAESISYTYTIPSTLTVFSMLFYYAVVLESPGHTPANQPRFRARIIDLTTGNPLPCVDFDFIAGGTPGGFQISRIPGNLNSQVLYKEWTPVSINLNDYIGKTIMLEFITNDCLQSGHAGYAYVDVSTVCNGAIQGSTVCIGDTSTTLTAPFGFQNYTWYSDNTFSTIISTSQTITFNPPPTVGTVYPVIVEPFPGFGCRDTLYATISVSPKPLAVAGPDVSICKYQQVQIGGPPVPGYNYLWTPASQVSSTISPNPFAWIFPPNPTEFIVKTTDLLTGCFSFDSTIVSTITVDTSVTLSGKNDFCINEIPAATLSVNNTSTAVQWYEVTTGQIPGATASTYQPSVTGNYWAQVTQSGCVDTTSAVAIAVHPLPLVSFTPNSDTGCVTKNSFLFTNGSTSPDNASMTYLWKFSDGSTSQITDAIKTFSITGTYNTELVTTTQFGCKDSSNQDVFVLPNGNPNFSWDSICITRPLLFKNLSNENGSAFVNYSWDFNNGGTGSLIKNPLPVVYTTPGKVDVTLKMVALGCENDTVSVIKMVQVNKQVVGIRYRDITVPQGSSKFLHVRDTIGKTYLWRPAIQLNSYYTQYTEFFATTNDVEYKIDITDQHTCVTTDTIQMLILRKPGYYLPSALPRMAMD